MWKYCSQDVSEAPKGAFGFVYLITNLSTGRMYVGRKYLTMSGGKNKKRKESKWREYWGSSANLTEDINEFGKACFSREILHWCSTKAETNYKETEEQFKRDVLNAVLADGQRAYYNGNIMSRWFVPTERSQESIERQRAKMLGFRHTEETKAKMRKPKAAGFGEKISAAKKGKPVPKELKDQISKKLIGRPTFRNKTGHVGIFDVKGRWRATYKGKYVGSFATIEEAVAAREAKIREEKH